MYLPPHSFSIFYIEYGILTSTAFPILSFVIEYLSSVPVDILDFHGQF
jgi:hypothetical protein